MTAPLLQADNLKKYFPVTRGLVFARIGRDFFAGVYFTAWPELLSYYRVRIAIRLPVNLIKYGGVAITLSGWKGFESSFFQIHLALSVYSPS